VQLIVTSRERLKLRGEHVYAVEALTFSATASLEEAAAAAVQLFVHSVQHVQADFQLTAANLAAVLRICALVQGMPLGLELAAANAGGLPLSAIADAIEQSAEFLTVDWRLVGPGGIGKTRLSLQVAVDLRDEFADGVCFVDLSPIFQSNGSRG
jgi:predicted ATPase